MFVNPISIQGLPHIVRAGVVNPPDCAELDIIRVFLLGTSAAFNRISEVPMEAPR